MKDGIELSRVIEHLRKELLTLTAASEDQDLRFGVEEVEVEFHVGVTNEVQASAGIKVWVLDLLGAEAKYGNERTHTIKLKLNPRKRTPEGEWTDGVEIKRESRGRKNRVRR